ncbi:nitrogen fixation protein NifQ [Geopsychrobacter electrodiphilus]|uniref:nitrogen fixation protein NifQ n=1 Tax=Geopsychrobacter electrodiphilus TaxID=225196 RepID=UPI000377BF24|nr:nitrogen fixation protein NifQ [Geopsychrobacter electrodiphilus]
MTGYSETILKYASDDSHAGTLEHPDGVGEVGLGATEAGRKLAVRFALQVEAERIKDVRYQVFGCGFTMAACAAVSQQVSGKLLSQAALLDAEALNRHLGGLPVDRTYCAELAIEALHAAVNSVQQHAATVTTNIAADAEAHGPRVTESDPVYRALIDSAPAHGMSHEDRHLFACLLAVADQEPTLLHQALNISELMLDTLLLMVFPAVEKQQIFAKPGHKTARPPEINPQVQELLLSFIRRDSFGCAQFASLALARMIAVRAAQPGHLWIAMGLFQRPQLSAAIGRHLPLLLAANAKKMRWKRYLFKQVCEFNGGKMCKSPVCGDCSDYALCFAPEEMNTP